MKIHILITRKLITMLFCLEVYDEAAKKQEYSTS